MKAVRVWSILGLALAACTGPDTDTGTDSDTGEASCIPSEGEPSFTEPANFAAGSAPWSIRNGGAADFDGDGLPDLFVQLSQYYDGRNHYQIVTLLNDGDGGFPSFTLLADDAGEDPVPWDADDDGDVDLFALGGGEERCSATLFVNDGSGQMEPSSMVDEDCPLPGARVIGPIVIEPGGPTGMIFADGFYWMAVGHFLSIPFTGPTSAYAIADFDGDGVDETLSDRVYARVAKGTYGPLDQDFGSYLRAVVGDWNADGALDFALFAGMSGVLPFYQTSADPLTFTPAGGDLPGIAGVNIVATDFDCDGDTDVLVHAKNIEQDRDEVWLLPNDSQGAFDHERLLFQWPGVNVGSVLVAEDFDGDGHVDVALNGPTELQVFYQE